MKRLLFISIAMSVLLTGCVARTYWMGKLDYPMRASAQPIEILLPGETISRPYEVLGVVQVDGWYATGTETLTRGAQREARKRGGDAIVLGQFGQRIVSYTTYIPGQPGYAGAAAASGPQAAAAAAVIRAPTPDRVIPSQVAWPIMSAIVIRYTDIPPDK